MGAQLTLSVAQTRELADCIKKHNIPGFYLAKDHGAYVGAGMVDVQGEPEGVVYYFRGCDPSKDLDYYEEARYKFGGDDFAISFTDTEFVFNAAKFHKKLRFEVTDSDVKVRMV